MIWGRVSIFIALLAVLGIGAWLGGAIGAIQVHLARLALERRDHPSAHTWIERAKQWRGNRAEIEWLQARLARRAGSLAEMDRHLDQATVLGADRQRIDRERLLASAQSGQLDAVEPELVEWLLDAGRDAPDICDAYANGLGMQGRLPEAHQVLDSWQADYPSDPEPHVKRGRIAEHDLDLEQAEQEYRQALSKSPHYPPALYALGRMFTDRKRPAEALPLFQQCSTVAPVTAPAADVGAARCWRLLGKPVEARKLLEQVLALPDADRRNALAEVRDQPEGDPAAMELGQLEADAKNDEAAEKWLGQAVAKAPRDLEARYALAVVLRRLGKRDEAQQEFDHVSRVRKVMAEIDALHDKLGQDRQSPEIRYEMGIRYLEHHSERAGVYWLQSAIACNPRFAPAHQALADYYAAKSIDSPAMAELAEHYRHQAEILASKTP